MWRNGWMGGWLDRQTDIDRQTDRQMYVKSVVEAFNTLMLQEVLYIITPEI
jgi:hypothetical protein